MRFLPATALPRWLERLRGDGATVWAPVDEDGVVVLRPWEGQPIASRYVNPLNSLKDVLLPRTETILEFEGRPTDLAVREPAPPQSQVVFGTRPCDAAAMELNDRVFLEGTFVDEGFRRRRETTTVLTVACTVAGPHCFCRAVGGSPTAPRGSDLVLHPVENGYLPEAPTSRGEKALRAASDLVEDVEHPDPREAGRTVAMPLAERIALDGLAARLRDHFEHPCWDAISRRCHSCGLCTFVCPTCYCFAVFDSLRVTRGRRQRGWDSCQFKDFLLMAGGHNPRPTRKHRVRQRFLHKLCYFPEAYGEYQCVGCGRCVAGCPVGLHLPAVVDELGEVLG